MKINLKKLHEIIIYRHSRPLKLFDEKPNMLLKLLKNLKKILNEADRRKLP